jgi:hypothetical protein
MEVWRCGGVEVWRCGGMEVWRCGGVEVWRCGGFGRREMYSRLRPVGRGTAKIENVKAKQSSTNLNS